MSVAPNLLEKMESALRVARLIIEEKDAEIANLREQIGGFAKDQLVEQLWRYGLTGQEAAMFAILHDARGRTLSKYELNERLPALDGVEHDRDPKIVDVTICKVRRKIGDEHKSLVETVWGRGYRLTTAGLALGDAMARGEAVDIAASPKHPYESRRILSDDQVREVRRVGYAESATRLAARMGCSAAVIHAIRTGYRYQNVAVGGAA